MHINLPYGTDSVPIDVPDNWINGRCYRPEKLDACSDQRAELMATLDALPEEKSLGAVAEGKKNCVIAVDTESPTLFAELLPALVEMVEDASDLDAEAITILLTNRPWEPFKPEVIEERVSEELRNGYRVLLHDYFDKERIVKLGQTSKAIPITLNSIYMEADLKIVLGGVRPDMNFGFTGGRQVLLPGLAGKPTLRKLFDFSFVTHPKSSYGNFRDNPFHITGIEMGNAAGCDMAISAVMNSKDEVHKIFAGHLAQSHLKAMTTLKEAMALHVREPMDIVVTSGGGAPKDSSLAKCVAALTACRPVLKPGGTIVLAAGLDEGIGCSGFAEFVQGHRTVSRTLERLSEPNSFVPGKWVAQKLYDLLSRHEVILFNKSLDENIIWSSGMTPTRDLNEAVFAAMESHGQRCKIVALPDGPAGLAVLGR